MHMKFFEYQAQRSESTFHLTFFDYWFGSSLVWVGNSHSSIKFKVIYLKFKNTHCWKSHSSLIISIWHSYFLTNQLFSTHKDDPLFYFNVEFVLFYMIFYTTKKKELEFTQRLTFWVACRCIVHWNFRCFLICKIISGYNKWFYR